MENIHDFVSPLDFRYYGADQEVFERLSPYVSERAFIKYQIRVERALLYAFFDLGWTPLTNDVIEALNSVTPEEVYEEEKKTQHVVRALVNCIIKKVSPENARFVHLFLTSADTTDTASALRFQELVRDVILPDLIELQSTLIDLARKHASTPQIGRTHGRHAEPITFGFAMALYVDRLGNRIQMLESARQNLRGKLSGAVGAYNALSLQLPRSAVLFEKLVLAYLGLQPAQGSISSQIVQPEYMTDLGYAAESCFSVLANLADDMRHLHRSEIDEVQEQQSKDTVGSSTMPHKVNPKNFENVKSLWKAFVPRMTTLLMDQISEHQRDLTNSASQRFLPELLTALDYSAVRLNRALPVLQINQDAMRKNLEAAKEHVVAEPLYVLLALHNYPHAYERVRALAREARERREPLMKLARQDPKIRRQIEEIEAKRPELAGILKDATLYTGQAAERAKAVSARREQESKKLLRYLQQEKQALQTVKVHRFSRLCERIRQMESGVQPPEDFCPAEDRKDFIEEWIRETNAGEDIQDEKTETPRKAF